MSAFLITAYCAADLAPVVALLQSALPREAITETTFARKVLLDPNFDPEGAFVARTTANGVCGFLLAMKRDRPLEDGPPDSDRGWITLFAVATEARRQGVGTALFDAAEAWLRSFGRCVVLISPYAPNYWTPGVDEEAYPNALAFLAKRGYVTVARPLSMGVALDVSWHIPEAMIQRRQHLETHDVRIVPFENRWIMPLTAFLRAEFPGDWQRYVRETMLDIVAGRRSATDLWLAVSDAHVLGFAQHEAERFGPIGVAGAERGHGVGAVLLFSTLEQMHQLGLKRAWFFWTDDATASRLYRPAGFAETRRFALLKKKLRVRETQQTTQL